MARGRHHKSEIIRPSSAGVRQAVAILIFVLAGRFAGAADFSPILGTNEHSHLDDALHYLNMTEADLGFDKDNGKPLFALQQPRNILHEPLLLPKMGDDVLAAVQTNDAARAFDLMSGWLDVTTSVSAAEAAGTNAAMPWLSLDPRLAESLNAFYESAQAASASLARAFAGVSDDEKRYLAASFLAGTFNAEDRAAVRADLLTVGVTSQDVARAIQESLELDSEPSSTNYLAIVRKIDLGDLLTAGRTWNEAIQRLQRNIAGLNSWPEKPERFATPLGPVIIGTTNADVYSGNALIILDPAGDDVYSGDAGAVNGLKASSSLAAVLDLAGNDKYDSTAVLGAGAALFGCSELLDVAGNDLYAAKYTGQAAAMFGTAWLEDRQGDDVYRAWAHAQAAAYFGLGYLRDEGGNDLYDVGLCGQAYAGVLGAGLLVDAKGNDRYLAGGREPDYERNDDRFVSCAQGFAIGMRPFAGGGVAALVDLAGDDTYQADIFGQGASYWYSVGMLIDVTGYDTYSVYQYGQGAGIHLSSGLLADGGGDDFYTGSILVQGCAHDFGVGMLFDRAGNDTYTGDQHAQGRALNNALAILVDSAGDDAYFARRPLESQGVGNDGDKREYGSAALLLDLAGKDRYSCGADDGARMLRPDFGIVYDFQPLINTNEH